MKKLFKLNTIVAGVFASVVTLNVYASASPAADRAAQIQQKLSELQQQGERVGHDKPSDLGTAVGVDCKVKWHLQRMTFDLPKIEMGLQVWRYHLPRTYWGLTSIGPIKLHLPLIRMEEHVTKLHVPEIHSVREEVKIHIPEFFCSDPKLQIATMKRKGEEIQDRAQTLVSEFKTAQADVVRDQLAAALKQIDEATAGIEGFVAGVEQAGGHAEATTKALQDLRVQRARAIAEANKAINQLLS